MKILLLFFELSSTTISLPTDNVQNLEIIFTVLEFSSNISYKIDQEIKINQSFST